jgi:hypothetical protein
MKKRIQKPMKRLCKHEAYEEKYCQNCRSYHRKCMICDYMETCQESEERHNRKW